MGYIMRRFFHLCCLYGFSRARDFHFFHLPYALTEGLLIPYQQYNDGYVASKLALYEAENAMAGICAYKYKGMHLLEKSYSMDEFEKATEAWEADKAK